MRQNLRRAVLGYCTFQGLDFVTTWVGGEGHEDSPVTLALMQSIGTVPALLVAKVVGVMLVLGIVGLLSALDMRRSLDKRRGLGALDIRRWQLLSARLACLLMGVTVLGNLANEAAAVWPWSDQAYTVALALAVLASVAGALVVIRCDRSHRVKMLAV